MVRSTHLVKTIIYVHMVFCLIFIVLRKTKSLALEIKIQDMDQWNATFYQSLFIFLSRYCNIPFEKFVTLLCVMAKYNILTLVFVTNWNIKISNPFTGRTLFNYFLGHITKELSLHLSHPFFPILGHCNPLWLL